ncbi:50S ribosomal protein L2 [Candidatus Woesearchaeota archaeon]|jgi:large subunit ribosomal protein L2|nr:50S ribosomal protein L2 [Candidatus Woesearchaeota archaeon]MBT6520316.1 50S ribosomal protein L2 [Candidatus Woesearchaeota archaeon]MBT7368269.1 50S ribosomal protein L2 [Candidatus Woesearchaeota archaeon]
MGKNIIQQARGHGGPRYRAPSFRYVAPARLPCVESEKISGIVRDIVHCQGHSAPLVHLQMENGEELMTIAAEGSRVGDLIQMGVGSEPTRGNIMRLKDMPEGTSIFLIESVPGDGGKFIKASGTFGKLVTKLSNQIIVQLPSKKRKSFHPGCRACVGVVGGGGRTEKPILKAGIKHYKMKAKNKLWPKVSGGAMNAVDHPYGNKRSSRKSKAKPVSRNAPPGRKVGMVAARRTGRKKGKD